MEDIISAGLQKFTREDQGYFGCVPRLLGQLRCYYEPSFFIRTKRYSQAFCSTGSVFGISHMCMHTYIVNLAPGTHTGVQFTDTSSAEFFIYVVRKFHVLPPYFNTHCPRTLYILLSSDAKVPFNHHHQRERGILNMQHHLLQNSNIIIPQQKCNSSC